MQVAQALHWLVATRCSTATLLSTDSREEPQQQRLFGTEDEAFLQTIGSAFTACSHALLSSLVDPLLMPCLKGLLEGTIGGRIEHSGTAGKSAAESRMGWCSNAIVGVNAVPHSSATSAGNPAALHLSSTAVLVGEAGRRKYCPDLDKCPPLTLLC